jgi:nicotinate-nucleotide adenylyltransferase
VIGADAFGEIASWKDYPRILEGTHFAVVSRPGYPVSDLPRRLPALASRMITTPDDQPAGGRVAIILIDAATAEVSSTAIRQRCADGLSIAGMVAPEVEQHIEQHGLYTSRPAGNPAQDRPASPAAGRLHGQS